MDKISPTKRNFPTDESASSGTDVKKKKSGRPKKKSNIRNLLQISKSVHNNLTSTAQTEINIGDGPHNTQVNPLPVHETYPVGIITQNTCTKPVLLFISTVKCLYSSHMSK
jgi:hypothetical protein